MLQSPPVTMAVVLRTRQDPATLGPAIVRAISELVETGLMSLSDLLLRMSTQPARIFNLPGGSLGVGAPADVVMFDPKARWTVDPSRFHSRSRNTPFGGRSLTGRAEVTIVRGRVVYQALED